MCIIYVPKESVCRFDRRSSYEDPAGHIIASKFESGLEGDQYTVVDIAAN